MSNKELKVNNEFTDFLDKNRDKLETSLVSLRFMKEIDDFIYFNDLTQRNFAAKMNVSEAYVSQLMSGVKRLNMGFLKNFEKSFNVEMKVKIVSEDPEYTTVEWINSDPVQLSTKMNDRSQINDFSFYNVSEDITVLNDENDSFLIAR